MEIIVRTQEELFSQTVERAYSAGPFVCAVNGPQYSLSNAGKADALWGDDPVAANHTTPDGLIVRKGSDTVGSSVASLFYIAQISGHYRFGMGDPPADADRAIGGVGPMIINGLRYGVGNICASEPACNESGPVPEDREADLVQRNNLTYAAQQSFPPSTGKTIIATNSQQGKLLLIVQRHGVAGVSFDDLTATLVNLGCDNAIFLDGSDSSMLHANGMFHVRQGSNKNETNTIGISFSLSCLKPPRRGQVHAV